MVVAIIVLTTMQIAHAQYGNPATNATQAQLKECKRLDISPEQCSDNTLLAKTRICIGLKCETNTPPPSLDPVTLSTMVGSGIAFVIGILAVRKIRKVRKKVG